MTQLTTMSFSAIEKVRNLTAKSLKLPQIELEMSHMIHGGMYARTIKIPAGIIITGVLIKISTIVIVSGNVIVFTGDDSIELSGYHVLAASKNRKQAFYAFIDTELTMIFPSNAKTIAEAEAEFTDEADQLLPCKNNIIITGE